MIINKSKAPAVLAALLWLILIPPDAFAKDIILPGKQVFVHKLALHFMPGLIKSEQALQVPEGKSLELHRPASYSGIASSRFTSQQGKIPASDVKGHLEVYTYVNPDLKKVLVDTSPKLKGLKESVCHAEGGETDGCPKVEFEDNPGTLEADQRVIVQSWEGIVFSDVNFINPFVTWDSGHCRVNWLRPSSTCSAVSAVIMRFTPEAPEEPTVVVVHSLNQDSFREKERILASTESFLQNDVKLNTMVEKVLAFKFTRSRDLIGTGFTAYIKNLLGYYIWSEPWIYDRDYLFPSYEFLPQEGVPIAFIDNTAKMFKSYHHSQWKKGKVSGSIYSGDLDHYDFLNKIHGYFSYDNAIQFDLAPGGIYFESNVISMVRNILGGRYIKPNNRGNPDGIITGGGTISIKAALKAYKKQATEMGITEPEIIIPESAHPAFDRGAEDYGLKLVRARIFKEGLEPSFTVDLEDVKSKITSNTVLLVGSATNYPYGTIDSIPGLAKLARDYDLDLHVDACLGGFVLAFLDPDEYGFEPFDFRVPEVTSISIDTHKYGKSLKGSSVVLFRHRDLSDHLGYVNVGWEGGIYAASGLEGSTSVGDFAAPWASLLKTGAAAYTTIAKRLVAMASDMVEVIRSYSDEFYVMGKNSMCFAFTSRPDTFDIMHIKDYLGALDNRWRFNQVQNPAGLHFCVTGPQLSVDGVLNTFKEELAEAVEYAKSMEEKQQISSGGGVYGMGNLGIRFNSTEETESFIRAGGYLLGDSPRPVTPLLENFKDDYRRVLYKLLKIRGARDKHFDPNDI